MKGLGRTIDDQQLQLEGRPDQANGDPTQAGPERSTRMPSTTSATPTRSPRLLSRGLDPAAQIRVTGGHATTSRDG